MPLPSRSASRRPLTPRKRPQHRHLIVTALTVLLAAAGSMVTATPAQAGLTPRTCTSRVSGDGTYKLDFCVRGWIDATNDHTRGVVEMHTYRYNAAVPGHWVDSVSRSVTLNAAYLANGRGTLYTWGADAAKKCRVNSPSGPVGCSVRNTSRVAFYGPDNLPAGTTWRAGVYEVSWRDASGVAHWVRRDDSLALITASWYA